MLRVSLLAAAICLAPFAPAALAPSVLAQTTLSAPSVKPAAELWYSEQFVVHSKNVGRDFLIQVAKPSSLAAGAKAPAIYLTDGNAAFGIAAGIAQASASSNAMAPAFIVGIGYPTQTRQDWQNFRGRDLTFAKVPPVDANDHDVTGEAAKFQRFIGEELRPLIEARYPVNRALLAGHSYGGLFALHILLNTPKAFDGYLIGSPSIWAEPGLLEKAASFRAPEKIPVFISVGAKEAQQNDPVFHMVSNYQTLVARLGDHASNLDLHTWLVPDENHTTVRPAFLQRAMELVLPPVPPAAAAR
jgi:predicted alpha/beta superfamily hydrolase